MISDFLKRRLERAKQERINKNFSKPSPQSQVGKCTLKTLGKSLGMID